MLAASNSRSLKILFTSDSSIFNLDSLGLVTGFSRLRPCPVCADVRALPLERAGRIVSQEARPCSNSWRCKVERAGQSIVVTSTIKVVPEEAAWAGKKLVVEEPRWQCRNRRVDVHVSLIIVRSRSGKRVWRATGPCRQHRGC